MSGTLAVLWKELREIRAQFGSAQRGGLAMLGLVGVFSVILPWQMGREWVTSPMMLAYWPFAAMSMVINVIADSFAGERERHTLETLLSSRLSDRAILLGKYLAAVVNGVGFVVVNLSIGLVTVNLTHGHGTLLLFPGWRAAEILTLVVLTSAFVAGIGVFVSLRAATVRQAHQTFGLAIMVLFLTPAIALQTIPPAWQDRIFAAARAVGAGRIVLRTVILLLAIDLALLLAATLRFQRRRLVLD